MKKTIELSLILTIFTGFSQFGSAQDYKLYLESFNSGSADFAAMCYKDGVVFCSNRNQKVHKNDMDSLQKYRTDLFFAKSGDSGEDAAQLFSKELTTWLNEGPSTFNADQSTIYYSGNIEPENLTRKDKIKVYKLGIFKANLVDGIWVKAEAFPYNTTNNSYDIAHPSLSGDGRFLFYSSNMEGTVGASDIFFSELVNGQWTEPKNLGAEINGEGTELFPFIDKDGRLFFSSNSLNEDGNMDIYYSVRKLDGSWRKPIRLPEPVNSSFDDFAFISDNSTGDTGFISSNRGDSKSDDIYGFQAFAPSFSGCNPIQKPNYCYLIEEQEIANIDSLPLVYEWDLGDGNRERGLSVKHCYAEVGTYQLFLNIKDTITGLTYSEVTSFELNIQRKNQANILSRDTIHVGEWLELQALDDDLRGFDLEEWYWDLGDGRRAKGEKIKEIFPEPGTYKISLGALAFPDESGERKESCVYKEVVVVPENVFVAQTDQDLDAPVYNSKQNEGEATAMALVTPAEEATYFVQLAESPTRIPYNAKVFDKVSGEIIERFVPERKVYEYTTGVGSSLAEVYEVFQNLADSGYTSMRVRANEAEKFTLQTTKTGSFIHKNDTTAINREFFELRDIKFEYDSELILEVSFPNLDYVLAMLEVEPSYRVSIKAHTDNAGGEKYNDKLSERRAKSVVDYFLQKGLDKERMVWQGYGQSKPIATNDTEEGRAQNRRVEFVIINDSNTVAR
jgi:outer membrane protein OmpA-like peptidoglycan-associated protein